MATTMPPQAFDVPPPKWIMLTDGDEASECLSEEDSTRGSGSTSEASGSKSTKHLPCGFPEAGPFQRQPHLAYDVKRDEEDIDFDHSPGATRFQKSTGVNSLALHEGVSQPLLFTGDSTRSGENWMTASSQHVATSPPRAELVWERTKQPTYPQMALQHAAPWPTQGRNGEHQENTQRLLRHFVATQQAFYVPPDAAIDMGMWANFSIQPVPVWWQPNEVQGGEGMRQHGTGKWAFGMPPDIVTGQDALRSAIPLLEEGTESFTLASQAATSTKLPSVGSAKHFTNECKLCLFFRFGICYKGEDCDFCHLEHSRRLLRRFRPSKDTRTRLQARVLKEQQKREVQQNPGGSKQG